MDVSRIWLDDVERALPDSARFWVSAGGEDLPQEKVALAEFPAIRGILDDQLLERVHRLASRRESSP